MAVGKPIPSPERRRRWPRPSGRRAGSEDGDSKQGKANLAEQRERLESRHRRPGADARGRRRRGGGIEPRTTDGAAAATPFSNRSTIATVLSARPAIAAAR